MRPAEGGPNLGLEPAWLCAPGSRPSRQKCAAQLSASTLQELDRKARRKGWSRGLRGAGARRRCRGPVQVGRGAARCPRLAGGGTEGEGSGNQVPREPFAAGPRRGSYLKGRGGRGHLRGGSGLSGLRRSWHSWSAGGGKKEGREPGPRCATARNSPPVFARAGVGRGGIKFGCLAAQAATPARPKGSGRWACLLLLVPYSLFSQSLINQQHQPKK